MQEGQSWVMFQHIGFGFWDQVLLQKTLQNSAHCIQSQISLLPMPLNLATNENTNICIYIVDMCIYIYIHMCMYVYIYTHMYIYIYIHTHTHTTKSRNEVVPFAAQLIVGLAGQFCASDSDSKYGNFRSAAVLASM